MKRNILKLHFNLFPKSTRQIFLDLGKIAPEGVLGGGTAIMLLLAHRQSFDLDVFLEKPIPKNLLVKLKLFYKKRLALPIMDSENELSVIITPKIKLSFIYFPFSPLHPLIKTESMPVFAPQDLASNKAYVIGRRGAWRDYVDLFCLLKSGLSLKKVVTETGKRFGGAFSEKLFLEQLTYWGDLKDFTIDYIGKEYSPREIQKYFQELVQNYLKLTKNI